MGLDMYLEKVKRVKGMTLSQIINTYNNHEAKKYDCTLKDWCGGNPDDVCEDRETEVMALYHESTPAWAWDNYTTKGITECIAYWRKANQIHNWFVNNIQNGEDDCGIYEVTKGELKVLLETCKLVKESSKLVSSKVKNGYRMKEINGEYVEDPIWEDGEVIEDTSVAEKWLPTTSGFFFGGTDYDQWYYEDIDNTITQLEIVLKETDFENEIVFYNSSW